MNKSSANPDTDDEVGQWRTMHMDLCLKVSAARGKSMQGCGYPQDEKQTTRVERLRIMDPLLQPASTRKLFQKDKNHNECYPKPLNCRYEKNKLSEKQNHQFLMRRDKLPMNRIPVLNTEQWNERWNCLKNVLLQTSGGEHANSNMMERTPTQLPVQPALKRLGDPADVPSHQPPGEPPQTESIDFEHSSRRSSSQLDIATQKVNGELSSKQNNSKMARNTQEINFERSSRRNRQQIERNILESNLEPAPRRNSYQRDRGTQVMNSEHSTRRNSFNPDRVSQEFNEQSSRRNSQQRDRNIQDFGFERRRNSNLIHRNMVESNFERSSKRDSNQSDIVMPQYGADHSLRRNSKQMDIVLPMCQPDRSGRRSNNLTDDTFRQCYYDATVQRESVLMDKGFRNFNKSRWENMAGSKPPKQQALQRPKQKNISLTDKNTKLIVPKRSSRWETMNIDKLHDPASNLVKRDAKVAGPILKKAVPKRTAQWEQVDRSIQIFSCEQEVPREVAYQKRAYPQYANRTERLNCPPMETSSKLFSDQWQRSSKPAAVSKIARGNSRWETPRLYDSGSTVHAQTSAGEAFQSCRQPVSRSFMAGVTAQQETILFDHPPAASPLPLGKSIPSNPASIGKTMQRPTVQGCLPSSANSVSTCPMLPESHPIRIQTQKEVIHVDSPLKNSGLNTAGTSRRGLSSTAFSANEHRPEHGGGGVETGDRISRSRGQLEVECEVAPMETGMQRSFAGETNLADGSISAELPM